jgi:CheY-like chemotaxis protein
MKDQCKCVLYVDDDPDDRAFLYEALLAADPDAKVVLAENGAVALDYLLQQKEQQSCLPCVIVLDLNMPVLDGRQTLIRLKSSRELRQIPVVVFTSSLSPLDRSWFSGQGIEFITKPSTLDHLSPIANRMIRYCA